MEYRKQRKMDLGDLFFFLYNSPEILKTKIHLLCFRFCYGKWKISQDYKMTRLELYS